MNLLEGRKLKALNYFLCYSKQNGIALFFCRRVAFSGKL